ncbi:MAG TPA: antitoxin Xre/MbcA/ParS toxin-binding domain-containing protein [Opitutaceae bacterium]|nr:antitoxin Xre/MbcA/ParS toxin-binding domain-containing protein [Opitutaceae bacterium]
MTTVAKRLSLPLGDDLALAARIESGLPASAIMEMRKTFLFPSISSVAALIGMSAKTAERRVATRARLARGESERLVRLIRIHNQAVDTFESEENARKWLQKSLSIFNGKTPLEMVATEPGARAVEQALGRLEHGVFG